MTGARIPGEQWLRTGSSDTSTEVKNMNAVRNRQQRLCSRTVIEHEPWPFTSTGAVTFQMNENATR